MSKETIVIILTTFSAALLVFALICIIVGKSVKSKFDKEIKLIETMHENRQTYFALMRAASDKSLEVGERMKNANDELVVILNLKEVLDKIEDCSSKISEALKATHEDKYFVSKEALTTAPHYQFFQEYAQQEIKLNFKF